VTSAAEVKTMRIWCPAIHTFICAELDHLDFESMPPPPSLKPRFIIIIIVVGFVIVIINNSVTLVSE
jgi:hypothetical protein